MNIDKFNEIAELRDKKEELEHLLNRLTGEGNPRVAISYYSDLMDDILSITLHNFEDLQNELNNVVKTWISNKLNEIENQIKLL